jgi:hypothetical protein
MTITAFASTNRLKTKTDTDGTTIIPGKYGHIYDNEDDEGMFGLVVMPATYRSQYWSHCRKALLAVGCQLVQDGEGEGSVLFYPASRDQVRAVVKAAGCKRRRQLSLEQRHKAVQNLKAAKRG